MITWFRSEQTGLVRFTGYENETEIGLVQKFEGDQGWEVIYKPIPLPHPHPRFGSPGQARAELEKIHFRSAEEKRDMKLDAILAQSGGHCDCGNDGGGMLF